MSPPFRIHHTMNRVRKAVGRPRGEDEAREGEDSMTSSEVAANDSKKQKSRRPPSMSDACPSLRLLTVPP